MTVTEIAEAVAERVASQGLEAQVYLFGSALRPHAVWSDIDLLIVCRRTDHATPMRTALSDLCLVYPIDLTIMSCAEEAELGFIDGEGCHAIGVGSSAEPTTTCRRRGPPAADSASREGDGDLRRENRCGL